MSNHYKMKQNITSETREGGWGKGSQCSHNLKERDGGEIEAWGREHSQTTLFNSEEHPPSLEGY